MAVAANLTLEFGDFRFENFESNANNDCVLTFVRAPGATWTKPSIEIELVLKSGNEAHHKQVLILLKLERHFDNWDDMGAFRSTLVKGAVSTHFGLS
jgi:hypothetical protein